MVFQRVGDPLLDAPQVRDGVFWAALALAAAWLASPTNAAVAEEALPTSQERTVSPGDRQYPKYPDPDAVQRIRLCVAIRRDDGETVLELLDVVDMERADCAPVLHEAARLDSWQVAKALLEAGFDANLGVDKPLHTAARHESPRVAALLIEYGAEVNARDDIGWTPLHYALVKGVKRPGFQTANMLLERGADVNAATAAVGWTPLHLAAHLSRVGYAYGYDGPDVLDIVQQLIERGADVGARTRVGAWSPAWVAKASEEPRDDIEGGASSQAVLAAIQAAGGEDEGCDAPRYRERGDTTPGCEYNQPFAVPGAVGVGGHRVAGGSFTAPGAEEALQFAGYGIVDGGPWLRLLSLEDRQGVVRPITTLDYEDYKGLCLDRQTNTHAAVFTRPHAPGGNCCEWLDTFYYQYDADVGNLALVFVDQHAEQPTGKNAECLWRASEAERNDHRRAARTFDDALSVLRVGEFPNWPDRNRPQPLWEGLLPTRAVSTEVVEAQLERLRGLPVGRVWDVDSDSPEWKVVVAEYNTQQSELADACEGVVLVWNGARQEWRSIYDCADFLDIEVDGDRLSAALFVGTCGNRWKIRACYLEVDLATWQAELWDQPHGDYWRNRRERPER